MPWAPPQEAYKLFDVNDDGLIEYEEFVNAMHTLKLGLSDKQLYELMSSIDIDRDSTISFDEFAVRGGRGCVSVAGFMWHAGAVCARRSVVGRRVGAR